VAEPPSLLLSLPMLARWWLRLGCPDGDFEEWVVGRLFDYGSFEYLVELCFYDEEELERQARAADDEEERQMWPALLVHVAQVVREDRRAAYWSGRRVAPRQRTRRTRRAVRACGSRAPPDDDPDLDPPAETSLGCALEESARLVLAWRDLLDDDDAYIAFVDIFGAWFNRERGRVRYAAGRFEEPA
jgi:hypothetical protein